MFAIGVGGASGTGYEVYKKTVLGTIKDVRKKKDVKEKSD